jgi:hypothetical protein
MATWNVEYGDEFDAEVQTFAEEVQDKLAAMALVLEAIGPQLSRPRSDTLNGSKHANMKELRFNVGKQVWRVAYAFDPKRSAILLVGGNKQGVNERLFYQWLIREADGRYDRHLASLRRRR